MSDEKPHPHWKECIALIDCPTCDSPHVKVRVNRNGRQYYKCSPNPHLKFCMCCYEYPPGDREHYEAFLANDCKPVDRRRDRSNEQENLRNVEVKGKRFGYC